MSQAKLVLDISAAMNNYIITAATIQSYSTIYCDKTAEHYQCRSVWLKL